MSKKLATFMRSGVALLVAFVMVLSLNTNVKAAKKASIYATNKKITLKYNSHADGAYIMSGNQGLESIIKNYNKKAKYSVKFKNSKVAKVVKNPTYKEGDDKTWIASKGVGSTKAYVYEKVGKAKKKKIGTIKINVEPMTMSEVAEDAIWGHYQSSINNVYLYKHLNILSYNLGENIHNKSLNNPSIKVHFDKDEYSISYRYSTPEDFQIDFEDEASADASSNPVGGDLALDASANASSNASADASANASANPTSNTTEEELKPEDIISLSDDGIITAKEVGTAGVYYSIKFSDGSELNDNYVSVYVQDTSIETGIGINMDNVRDHIVGLDTPVELADGSKIPMINFDNASTTPAFKEVQAKVNEELNMYGSIGRGFSQKSNHSTDVYNEVRQKVLDYVGADSEHYTCFYVNSTTDGLNKLASALVESKNDIVCATRIEHHANDLSWRERCKVVYAEVDDKGRVDYDSMEKMLKKYKVKYVTVTAASNVTGYVTDVHRVAKMAHKYGAKIIVDCAQIVAHRKFSMLGETPEENIDFIAFSAHKMYSPFGGGAVVGLSEELNKHIPTFYGGGTITIVGDDWQHYKDAPARYEAGSPNYPGVVGLGKAIDIMSEVGLDKVQEHEKVLNKRLIDGLKKLDNIIIYGDSENIDDRVGVVTFNFTDVNTQCLAQELSQMGGVATRRGAFCAHPYVWRLMNIPDDQLESFEGCADAKTPGMIRVSFGIYNTEEEVDKLLELLPKAIEKAKVEQTRLDVIPEY